MRARSLTAATAAALIAAVPAHAAFNSTATLRASSARAGAVFKPRLVAAPQVTGLARETQTLTGTDGTWERQATSVTRSWLRCDPAGEQCTPIAGATGTTYVLTSADVDRRIRLRVVAQNAGGSSAATSDPTAVVTPVLNRTPPANLTAPTVGGTAAVDDLLTVDRGSWSGIDNAYALQWQRCSPAACTDLKDETGTTYRPDAGEIGSTFRVRVTATNDGGTTTVVSAPTAAIVRRAFTYVACADPDTGKGVGPAAGSWPAGFGRASSGSGITVTSLSLNCAAGTTTPQLHQAVSANTYESMSASRWTYTVPPGETMVGGYVWRASAFSAPLGTSLIEDPANTSPTWRGIYGCWPNFGCLAEGTASNRFGASNRMPLTTTAPTGFGYTLHCHTNGSLCAASGWNAIYGARISLRDDSTPTLASAATGTLATGAQLGASATLGLDARDSGSGLYRAKVRVDGATVDSQVVGANGGLCADVNPANGDPYEFASHTPCAAAFSGTLTFDTTAWPQGTHAVAVVVEDAGGNTVTAVKRTVQIGA